ncbi:hypothetical protein ACQHIV_11465 [Kribbella sp. GL6]|uniref:hypothetical protein n=1 Tax=Kribbella sp. GL6 TaxID=3419765 RepID=UPI003CFD5014
MKVLVQPPKNSLDAIATDAFSSRSVRTSLRGGEDVGDEHAQDQACDAADDINLDMTCLPRVPGATKICLRGA